MAGTRENSSSPEHSHPSTRSALQEWLDESARLLEEQRAQSISPSFAAAVAADEEFRTALDMRTVQAGLADMLSMLSLDPGRWILIFEFGNEDTLRYLQYLVCEDGSLVAETVSNYYLEDWTSTLGEADEALLAELGWEPPDSDHHNWQHVDPSLTPDITTAATLGIETLRRSFGCADDDGIRVIMFSSPLREGTPASSTDNIGDFPVVNIDQIQSPVLPDPQEPHWAALRHEAWEEFDGLPWQINVTRWAARAMRAWLIAEGLAAEMRRVAASDPSSPTRMPGLDDLLEQTHWASIEAHHSADKVLADPAASDADETAVRCAHAALETERLTRRIAQLAMGVSACLGSDPIHERLDRAAVAVIHDPLTRARMSSDGIELVSTTPDGLLLELSGLICRTIIEPGTVVGVGPVEMFAGANGNLTLACEHERYDWEAPVRVYEPASYLLRVIGPPSSPPSLSIISGS